MFYLKYLLAEIFRRWGKTLTITFGLAIASAIIILIISVSSGLSSAQEEVLNPLENVGTDIMLSRSVSTDNVRDLDEATRNELMSQNRISTDLSKLGNPGDDFIHDTFLPGTMLTFETNTTEKLDKNLVAGYTQGLIMNISHQEGKVPKVTAEFETGGEKIQVNQEISPMTDAERDALNDARDKAMEEIRSKGLDPRSEEGRSIVRNYQDAATPERLKKFSTEITTERRRYSQDVGPISTDIKTETYTVSGVDTSKTNIGLILPSQIIDGSYFNGDNQIVINKSYADKQSKKVGDKITLGGKKYGVVGIVDPKLYTNTTDLYLPLAELQKIAGKENRINLLLIKSANATSVEETSKQLEGIMTGAKVINSKDTAKQVSGSLVSAANLTNRFIGITSIIVVIASFIIVSLLTISSINKRTREIGTLKAIGWSNTEVIRQIVSENIALGIIGAILGLALGALAVFILNKFDISLSANVTSLDAGTNLLRRFGPGGGQSQSTTSAVATSVHLKTSLSLIVMLLGSAVAIGGSVISGFLAALKASRLRPQVALRNLE
ncbi:MAG TPA: FtsX-like permease family protein [bacterium]|nr:FtsX-like permease family protein [bacterium]